MTTKPPQQQARELAERCVNLVLVAQRNGITTFGQLKNTILHELNLEQLIEKSLAYDQVPNTVFQLIEANKQLIADKERLDWLERCYDWQFRPKPNTWLLKESEQPLRLAIDSAISAQGKEE